MTEYELQEECFRICECAMVDYMHIPNESGTADRRALGMRRGVPDLILVDKSVMFVELKRNEKIKASQAQQEFMSALKTHKVASKLVGSTTQFRRAINNIKKNVCYRPGVPLYMDFLYKDKKSDIEKVSAYFLDRQECYNPNELFAIKLFNKQNKEFPWLCNIRDHNFVATKPTRVTSKLLLAGWDVIYI